MRNGSDLPAGHDEPGTSDSGAAGSGRGAVRIRGRRAVLLGAGAAGAGAAASLAGGAAPASAAPVSSRPVLLGKANTETTTTTISNGKGTALSASTAKNGHFGVKGTDASSGGAFAVYGTSKSGFGVYGISTNGTGVAAQSDNSTGASGLTYGNAQSGVFGIDASTVGGYGVRGRSDNGDGVYGTSTSTTGYGVYGQSSGNDAIHGVTSANHFTGVAGLDQSASGGYGVYGFSENGTALWADGKAIVTGSLSKGGGSFKIDHPLDPAGKYLYHSFVESPDMMNIYNGTVTLGADGRATVRLPDWFEALNRDYRYQLTPIGHPAPDLHIAAEVSGGEFAIAGGAPRQRISWQVTGIRQDAWANANRIPVEEAKPAEDHGRYLHPEVHGGEPITSIARARAERNGSFA